MSTALALLACSTDDAAADVASASPTNDAAAAGDSSVPGVDAALTGDAAADGPAALTSCAAATPYCKAYIDYASVCGFQKYTCDGGCSYVPKCNAFDTSINSEARRAAEIDCFTAANCDTVKRRDCGHRKFADHPQTTAQQALATQYCATCAAGDASCTTTAVTYDGDAGALATTAIFSAAWSFSDAVTSEIAMKCTGAALDGGAAGSCDAAFGACVQKVVLARPESSTSCK
jgi:hypothetical protein